MQNINKSNIHNAFDYLYARALSYELYAEHDQILVCPVESTEDMRKYFDELGARYVKSDDYFIFYT